MTNYFSACGGKKQLQATVCLSAQKSSQSRLRGVSSNQIGAKTLAVTEATVVETDGIDIDDYLHHFWLLDESLFGLFDLPVAAVR